MREDGSTLAADTCSGGMIFGGVGLVGGRGSLALARRFGLSAAETNQQQHNKALHPTAYSLRFGRSSLRSGFRRRVSLVVVSLRLL